MKSKLSNIFFLVLGIVLVISCGFNIANSASNINDNNVSPQPNDAKIRVIYYGACQYLEFYYVSTSTTFRNHVHKGDCTNPVHKVK